MEQPLKHICNKNGRSDYIVCAGSLKSHVTSPRMPVLNIRKRAEHKNVESKRRYCSLTFAEATSVQTQADTHAPAHV